MDWSESSDVLATTLAHEMGHALLKGGTGGSGNTPAEAQATSHTNEDVALQAEYIVATQLGLKGGAAGNIQREPTSFNCTLAHLRSIIPLTSSRATWKT